MKITRENLKNIVREAMVEENAYQEFFKKALEKTGKSIPQMSDEEKKSFFNKIDSAWKGKGEKNEGNAFGAAVADAKKDGDDSFKVGGKEYKVESNEEDLDEEAVVVSKRTPEGNIVSKLKEELESVNEGKFKVDDLVYNKRTKTVGIVRMGDDKYGEVKTDADGNVDVDELEKYNPIKFKHQTKAKVAPSTEKEVSKRGLFNPFKNESVNEGPSLKIKNSISKKEWDKTHKNFKSIIDGVHYVMKLTNQGTALVPVKIEESVNEEFKSKDSTFEKVYGMFDKRDYFNAKGLAKVQIGNFERALQKNDKGAQQILDKFNGDMDKAKEYIIQVITDRKKEEAFNQYKAFKAAVDSIQKGNPIYGAVDLVKSRIHNNSQKYTMALYSTLRNQKFNKWKDVHSDVDSLIGESVNEEKYTVIDPRGNSLGTADKTQVFMAAKKKGGEKTGHFVVSAKNALKARRTLEKFKGDFKNPKLKDIMAGLYESVNEARTVSKPIKVDDDTMVQIVGDNKGFRELTAALNPKTGKPIQKFGFDRGNETANSKEELIKKLQKKYGNGFKFESVNEAKTYTPKQVKQALEKMVKQLKAKWKQKGGYENFGQRELDKFKKTFGYNPYGSSDEREISDLIDSFEDWAMDYSG